MSLYILVRLRERERESERARERESERERERERERGREKTCAREASSGTCHRNEKHQSKYMKGAY